MNYNTETLEGSIFRISSTIPYSEVKPIAVDLYMSVRSRLSLPGFRKGHVTRQAIDAYYGKNYFTGEAIVQTIEADEDYQNIINEKRVFTRPTVKVDKVDTEGLVEFHVDMEVEPELTFEGWEGMNLVEPDSEVTEEMINNAIDGERQKQISRVSITDRPAKDGDRVFFDFDGTIDGVPFNGGSGKHQSTVLGKPGRFLEDLTKGLYGMQVNEEKDIPVHFADDYGVSEGINGKDAVFHVKMDEIIEEILPELDDDFVQDISEFDTVEEYREDVKKHLEEDLKTNAKNYLRQSALAGLARTTKIDLPKTWVDQVTDSVYEAELNNYKAQGMDLETMLKRMPEQEKNFRANCQQTAMGEIVNYLVISQFAEQNDISVSDEEFDAYLEQLKDVYGANYANVISSMSDETKQNLRRQALEEKTLDAVVAKANIMPEKEFEKLDDAAKRAYLDPQGLVIGEAEAPEAAATEEKAPVAEDAPADETAPAEEAAPAEDAAE